jgi:hypothetical protein
VHWARRARTWLIAAVVAGVAAAVTTFVTNGIDSGAAAVKQLLLPGPGSGATVQDTTLSKDGLTINTQIEQGLGCEAGGDVYPVSRTPGISTRQPPGSGLRHGGRTWDQAPVAFGAVPAGPAVMLLTLTGPKDHAVTVTGLRFHVVSRKPQVAGPWLNKSNGCGAGGEYRYGLVDLDTAPPYYLPPTALPSDIRADALKFPYTTTANDPESLLITVQMEHCDCRWDAVLTWVDGSQNKSKVITDHGHPFETTSVTGQHGVNWYGSAQHDTTALSPR